MIAVKLPQVDVTDTAIIASLSLITFEIMSELEKCFKVRYRSFTEGGGITYNEQVIENEVLANVGDEDFYTTLEKSITADMVCMQWLFSYAISQSSSITTTSAPTFVKKAKAGSAEVEYDKADSKTLPFLIDVEKTMGKFKADAQRKALSLGCAIDICDDCTFKAYLSNPDSFIQNSFLVVRSMCN